MLKKSVYDPEAPGIALAHCLARRRKQHVAIIVSIYSRERFFVKFRHKNYLPVLLCTILQHIAKSRRSAIQAMHCDNKATIRNRTRRANVKNADALTWPRRMVKKGEAADPFSQ